MQASCRRTHSRETVEGKLADTQSDRRHEGMLRNNPGACGITHMGVCGQCGEKWCGKRAHNERAGTTPPRRVNVLLWLLNSTGTSKPINGVLFESSSNKSGGYGEREGGGVPGGRRVNPACAPSVVTEPSNNRQQQTTSRHADSSSRAARALEA